MTKYTYTNGTKTTSTTTLTLKQASDDSLAIDSTSSLSDATKSVPTVTLDMTAAPASIGIVINNAGLLQSGTNTTSAGDRTIDTTGTAVSGSKVSITNTGTIINNGDSSGNDDAIRINTDLPSGTFLLYNTVGTNSGSGLISTLGTVSDSVAVRLGKTFTASKITINNGIDASGNITAGAKIITADADAIRPGGVNTSGTVTGFGSSTINNYGTISANYQTGSTTAYLTKDNGIDIGAGQAATVNNFGTIDGDESGLGSDNTASTTNVFAPTYYVTNNVGATIAGYNGPGIAIGNNTSSGGSAASSTTSTITNYGTISGKATGVGRTLTNNVAPAVSAGNGTGIYSSYGMTIVNGSTANSTATIQGSGVNGTTALQGATYYAVTAASGSVTNYGVIKETTATNAGAAVNFTGSDGNAATVTNYGTITGANGLGIATGSGNDTVSLYSGSTVTGSITTGAGNDTVNLYAGETSGAIDGGAGSDILNLNAASSGTVTAGTLTGVTNVETLAVNGGAWTITDAETYSSGATIASGATLAIGASGSIAAAVTDNGTLNFKDTGSLTQSQAITGSGTVVQSGNGTLVLSNGGDTYSGGTSLQSGTLDVTTVGAAGTGAITFGSGAQTLQIEQAALNANGSFANTLAGVGPEDTIDLRSIGTETAASFDSSTNKLTVTGGSQAVTLQLDAAGAPASGYAYGLTSDGNGGTLVAIDQVATVQSVTSSPSSGYVKAGQSITLTITTSKPVTISGSAPVLNLRGGGTAIYDASSSTSTSLVFRDTVASGQDASGIVITSVTNAASVQDASHVPVNFGGAVNQTAFGPTIDTTAPTVAITSAAGLTNQATQTISGTVDGGASTDDGTTVTVYETFGGATNAIGTAKVSNGAWSTTANLSSGNGTHTIYATDTDAAGNTGTSASVSYDLETNAPHVSITSSGGLTNQPMQTITGSIDVTADPQAIGTTVTVTDTTKGTTLGTGTVGNDGSFSVGVTLSGEGTHSLQVGDTDKAQNSGYATVSYNLDTTPPATPSLALAHDTGTSSTDGITSDPTITYTASANGDTLLYAADGATTYSTTAPVFAVDGSQDGQHTVSVEEEDPAGNVSTAASLTFTLDTTAPTTAPSITLANDTGASNSDNITKDPTLSTAVGTNGDTLVFKGANGTYSTTTPTFTSDGTYTVTAAEEDPAGNIGPASSLTFTLDTTPPAAPGIALADDTGSSSTDNITNDSTIKYTLSAAGDTLLYKVGNGAYSSTAPTFTTDGTYTVSAEEVDTAGNVSAAKSLTFTRDTTPPDIDFTSLGGSVNKATQVVNGMVGVEDAGTTVSIFEDGGTTAVATAVVNAAGYFSANVNLGADGTHTLTASDTDKAGNTGSTDESVTYNLNSTAPTFTPGNLVVSVSGDGDGSGDYGDNQATPLTLEQFTTDGTYVNQLVLPQTTTTVNGVTESVISAEYGSSSEGSLQLSADGHSLVIAGYGINAQTYNAGGAAVYGNAALAQSTSVKGGTYTAVPRVIAEINANGTVDTSTVLYNVFNTNNPRSVATVDGSSFYISGQGVKGDKTQGLYYVQDGATTATAIDQSTDTRTVEIYNGQLYLSRDSKQGSGGTSNISSYGSSLPTSATTGQVVQAISQSVVITAANGNSVNASAAGTSVNLDPENFYFANADTLYVADGGIPKAGGVGDGGLQKWVSTDGVHFTLAYTLSAGLSIVAPGADEGTTGLIGLAGQVVGGTVQLYATNQTVGDTDQKYVFGINDPLSATTNPGQSFTTLVTAAPDTNIRGISFAPTALTPTVALAHDTGASATDDITNNATISVVKARGTDSLLFSVNGGAYSATAPTFSQDGTYTLSVEEKDKSGSIGPASSLTFTLDTKPPATPAAPALTAASDTGSSSSDGITSDTTPTFTGTAEAGSTVTLLDGTNVVGTATADATTGAYSVTSSTLADGTHNLSVTATDTAGNVSNASASATVVIDTTAPAAPAAPTLTAASDTGSSSSDGITNDATPTFTGLAEAGSTVTLLDGTTVVGTTTADASTGAYSVTASTLADGSHSLSVTATDAAGNVSNVSASDTIVIDTKPPATPAAPTLTAASDTGSSSSDGITNDATPTFTGTAEAGATVTLLDGTNVVGTTTADATSGAYSVTASTLADGTHNLRVTATDTAGNVSNASASDTIVIDTRPPLAPAAPTLTAASDTGTSSSDGVTSDTTPTFTGTAETGSTVTLLDGTTVVGTTTADASTGAYSVTASTLADGSHNISVTATDAAGNVSNASASDTVVIDTTPPAAPDAPTLSPLSDSGSSSSDGITNDATPTFSGRVEPGSTVTLYDGTKVVGTTTADAMKGLYWITASKLADGTHNLSVTATDAAGNVSAGSATTSVTIDTTPPAAPAAPTLTAASDSGSSSSDGITNDATPTFTGTAEPGSTVTLRDGTKATGITVVGTTTADATTGAYSITASKLADGSHSLSVTATDAAGNVSGASATTSVSIDTTPPATPAAPTLTAASDSGASSSDGITNVKTPTFTGTAEAGAIVTLYDGTTKVGSTTAAASGAYSVASSALADGAHSLTITATDKAGNVSTPSASTSVTIDTKAPAAPQIALANDTGVSSSDRVTSDPTITYAAPEAGVTLQYYADKGTYSTTPPMFATDGTADGTHTVYVRAVDTAGNVGPAASLTFTLDTQTPAVPAAPTLSASFDTGASSSDGITKSTTLVFTGKVDGRPTITLYDGTTKVGSALADATGAYSITLRGATEGSHSYTVTATDAAGNTSAASAGSTVVVDTTAPSTPAAPTLTSASDTGASSTDGITSVATPTVTGTAEAGSTVILYDGTTKVGSAMAGTNGGYSITASTLSDGAHTLKVTATDAAGNVSAYSAPRSIVIDTKAPAAPAAPTLAAASDTGASSTDGITSVTTPTFTGTAEAGSTVTLFDGATAVGSAVAATNGAYSITASTLAAGSHTLTVKATDTAGNVSTASAGRTITIDTTPPAAPAAPTLTAASDTGASSSDGITSVATPTFTGTAEAGSTVTLLDGTKVVGSATANATTGAYSVKASKLADGSHSLSVTATDTAGNVSVASTTTSVTIDTKPPATPATPTLTAASDTGTSSSDGITSVATPTFTGTAEAGSTVTLLDGTTVVGTALADATSGAYSITSSTLADGSHALKVTATDAAGNVSVASGTRTVVIETVPPAVPAAPTLSATFDTGASSSDGITKSTTLVFTGKVDGRPTITLYDGTTKVGSALADATGAYSITLRGATEGSHSYTVTATDAAGNTSAASAGSTVVVDTTAPSTPAAPTLTSASDTGASSTDGITSVATPTVTGTAEAGSTVILYDGTTKVGSAMAGTNGGYSITASTLSDGAHTLKVTATDAAGNVSAYSAPRSIVIDTKAPAPTITNKGGAVTAASQTITGTGEAGSTVTLTDNGNAIGTAVTVGSNGSWSQNITLSAGSNSIAAMDVDKAGNAGTSPAVTFQYSASMNKMVQAMSMMSASPSTSMTPTAASSAQEHPLAASHG